MPRKPKDAEPEVDISTVEPKRETYARTWFLSHTPDNQADLKIVCDLTARSVEEQFNLRVRSGNTELFGVVFYATFITILEYLKAKEKTYNNYTIQIANSINIGFTNNTDEENEKVGNVFPIIEYISVNRAIVDDGYEPIGGQTEATNYIRWKQLNTKKEVEVMKEIQLKAHHKLQEEFHTSLRTDEAIIPLFSIFMDNINSLLKYKYKELAQTDVSEVSMDVFGLFKAFYSMDEDDNEIYEYEPSVATKLMLKNDETAARGE